MPQLWVPAVDQELHLQVVQQVQLELLVPVEVKAAWAHDCSGLVDVVHFHDAIQVSETLEPARRFQTSSCKNIMNICYPLLFLKNP